MAVPSLRLDAKAKDHLEPPTPRLPGGLSPRGTKLLPFFFQWRKDEGGTEWEDGLPKYDSLREITSQPTDSWQPDDDSASDGLSREDSSKEVEGEYYQGSWLDTQERCVMGHPLVELSRMCDSCHGLGHSSRNSANSPVLFCTKCDMIFCSHCFDSGRLTCPADHTRYVNRLRLVCDKCDYCNPYCSDKRRDPHDKKFKIRKDFTTAHDWETAEAYSQHARSFYGCRQCNYDLCSKCARSKVRATRASVSVMVRGTRVHILSFRPDLTRKMDPVLQMIYTARTCIPAVLNFLYLRKATKRACIYFGRFDEQGKTVGLRSAQRSVDIADLLRSALLKILLHEIWPPLKADSPSMISMKSLFRSDMQALLWIKHVEDKDGKKNAYAKLVLQNVPCLYFDNALPNQDKHRWRNRRLHIRRLDNLETARAVDSYDAYFSALQNSCRWARAIYLSRAGNVRSPTLMSTINTKSDTSLKYHFGQRLFEAEDSMLDYKSYWVDPVGELIQHVPDFMTGFANAYGSGKLLVGVMEVHLREILGRAVTEADYQSKAKEPEGRFWNAWRPKPPPNWTKDPPQDGRIPLVVGLPALTRKELSNLTREFGQAFKACLPPLPPDWVTITQHFIDPPTPWRGVLGECVVFYLYSSEPYQDRVVNGYRSTAHKALRTLLQYGLGLSQLPASSIPQDQTPSCIHGKSVVRYLVVRGDSSRAVVDSFLRNKLRHTYGNRNTDRTPPWRKAIRKVIGTGTDDHVSFLDHTLYSVPKIPQLVVLDVEIIRKDSDLVPPDESYGPPSRPLFFTGWPSIPIWDEVNDTVTKIPKDLKLLDRRRLKIREKHPLVGDPLVLQRICSNYSPKGGAMAMATQPAWKSLIPWRLICKDMLVAVNVALGIESFVWSGENVQPPTSYISHLRMPSVLKLFHSSVGDIPGPYPYVLASPCTRNASFVIDNYQPLSGCYVTPFLKRIAGFREILEIVIHDHTGMLYYLDHSTMRATPVCGVTITPVNVDGRIVGGFSFEVTTGTHWDLPAFMGWFTSVKRDSIPFGLDIITHHSLGLDPFCCDQYCEIPSLCVEHYPADDAVGNGSMKGCSVHQCDWHDLELKWQRNSAKRWRF